MFLLKSEAQFDTAHFLYGYDGKCANIHGHRYRLVVTLRSETLCESGQARGMVADFNDLKEALREITDEFDHKLILEDNAEGRRICDALQGYETVLLPYRPTAEEMSRDIFYRIRERNFPVWSVELFETPANSCTYMES